MKVKLPIFCAVTGALAGIVFWLFLFLINRGTWLLWDLIPGRLSGFKAYPFILCTAGGLIIGIVRVLLGDYPEDMMTVFRKLKKEKTYPYKKLPTIIICALLPLIFGASVGPEAGMVGVVAALCCFAADAMKLVNQRDGSLLRRCSCTFHGITARNCHREPVYAPLRSVQNRRPPDAVHPRDTQGRSDQI